MTSEAAETTAELSSPNKGGYLDRQASFPSLLIHETFGKLQETRLTTNKQMVEKGDQMRSRDRETIIIPEPQSDSSSITQEHPQGVLRPRGELITKQSQLAPHGWQETNVLAAKGSLGEGR